jgi:hypothetical protein
MVIRQMFCVYFLIEKVCAMTVGPDWVGEPELGFFAGRTVYDILIGGLR